MKKSFRVTVTIPEGATVKEVASHIEEAVTYWGGQCDPRDPLFSLGHERVTVVSIRRKKK